MRQRRVVDRVIKGTGSRQIGAVIAAPKQQTDVIKRRTVAASRMMKAGKKNEESVGVTAVGDKDKAIDSHSQLWIYLS